MTSSATVMDKLPTPTIRFPREVRGLLESTSRFVTTPAFWRGASPALKLSNESYETFDHRWAKCLRDGAVNIDEDDQKEIVQYPFNPQSVGEVNFGLGDWRCATCSVLHDVSVPKGLCAICKRNPVRSCEKTIDPNRHPLDDFLNDECEEAKDKEEAYDPVDEELKTQMMYIFRIWSHTAKTQGAKRSQEEDQKEEGRS